MPRILVVDDDQDSRELLCELLQAYGYDAIGAANGREGLERLDDTPQFSLILLDLMMPVMDGWEFRRRQQHHPSHAEVPVVVATAGTRMNDRAGDLQAAGLLTKPLDFPQVLALVRQLCGAPPQHSTT